MAPGARLLALMDDTCREIFHEVGSPQRSAIPVERERARLVFPFYRPFEGGASRIILVDFPKTAEFVLEMAREYECLCNSSQYYFHIL